MTVLVVVAMLAAHAPAAQKAEPRPQKFWQRATPVAGADRDVSFDVNIAGNLNPGWQQQRHARLSDLRYEPRERPLSANTQPEPPGFDDLTGLYHLDDGRLLEIFDLVDQTRTPQLVALDPDSGRVWMLHVPPSPVPASLDFEARPGWFASERSDARLRFTLADHAVTGLVLEDETTARGRRLRFRERELTFRNGDVTLSGSLVLPDGPGPHPAIVIVHGSGPLTCRAPRYMAHLFAHRGSQSEVVSWRETDRTATAVVRETNDYFRLLERGTITTDHLQVRPGWKDRGAGHRSRRRATRRPDRGVPALGATA